MHVILLVLKHTIDGLLDDVADVICDEGSLHRRNIRSSMNNKGHPG